MTLRAKRWLWAAALLALALLVLKSFVFGVYLVDTASMEPTILGTRQGGERVLVRYDRSAPARFDLVVALRPGEDAPVVKRVGALPGERVQIVDGDLLVHGQRLAPECPRPRPIPVFDDRWQRSEEAFTATAEGGASWAHEGGEWRLDARAEPPVRAQGELALRRDVKDDYLDREHAFVAGETSVNDLVLRFELRLEGPGSLCRTRLSEQGDFFELELERRAEHGLHASLWRRGVVEELLAERELDLDAGAWHRVRFANLDNALALDVDGERRLLVPYAENRLAAEDRLLEGRNYVPRVVLGGSGGSLALRTLSIERDLYYTQRGEQAVRRALTLDPGQYLLLGDHSAFSRDGREWGGTPAEELLGRPWFVIWPFSHARALEGAVPSSQLVR